MKLTRPVVLILLVTTHFCLAAEPRLQRDVDARRVKLLEPILLAPYQASVKADAPWAKDAAKLIPIALWHVQPVPLDWWSGTREVHDRDAARVHARAIAASNCDDPYALFAAAWMLTDPIAEREPKAGDLLVRACLAIEKANAHPLARFLIAQRLRSDRRSGGGDGKTRQRLDREWPQYAVDAIASDVFGDADRHVQAILIRDWDHEHPEYAPPRDYLRAITDSPKVDDWFKALTRGRHEADYAWIERGSRSVDETTPAQLHAFTTRLDAAAKALEQAWKLSPDDADAPAQMIKVEMGRGGGADAARVWLERAMQAQFDHPEAWLYFMTAAMPRWGGSTQQLLHVAEVAAATGRYDTRVPWFAIDAFRTLAYDDRPALASPGVYASAKRICAGYRAKPPPGMAPMFLDSVEAAFALRANEWKDAAGVFKRAGDQIDAVPLSWVGYDVPIARMKSAALASPVGKQIEQAVQTDDAGDRATALVQYQAAAAQVGDNAEAARYIKFRTARLQFMRDFESGKPARLFDPSAPECWLADQGEFKLQPDSSLRVDQAAKQLRAAFRPPLSSKNFAIRGRLTLDAAKPAALPEIYISPGVIFGDQDRHYAVVFSPGVAKEVALYRTGNDQRHKVDFGKGFDFAIEVVRRHITVRVNGNAIISDQPVENADRFGTIGVWIHNFMRTLPATVTLSDFTMQKLEDDGRPVGGN